mgnify:CR=1 FL=1
MYQALKNTKLLHKQEHKLSKTNHSIRSWYFRKLTGLTTLPSGAPQHKIPLCKKRGNLKMNGMKKIVNILKYLHFHDHAHLCRGI